MNRRLYELSELSRNISNDNFCNNCSAKNDVSVPDCINTDFCVSSPRNMNDGILTLAFVDMQPLDTVYQTDAAFCNGTLFPNLDKPWFGGRKR